MPKILIEHPDIKLIITGGGYQEKNRNNWLINKGKIKKEELYYYLKNAECLVTPLIYGSGTRIKIIKSLCIGTKIITTSIGIDGINFLNRSNNNIIITDNIKLFPVFINQLLKNKNNHSNKKDMMFYRSQFSMKNLTKKLYKKIIY